MKPLEAHSILCIFSLNNIVCVKAVSKLKSIIYVRYFYDLSFFLLICCRDTFGSFLCNPCCHFYSFTSLVFCILISAFLPSEGCLMMWIIRQSTYKIFQKWSHIHFYHDSDIRDFCVCPKFGLRMLLEVNNYFLLLGVIVSLKHFFFLLQI